MKTTKWIILGIAVLVIGGGIWLVLAGGPQVIMGRVMGARAAPEGLDTSRTRITEQGSFFVTYSGAVDPLPVNQIHTWTVHVETAGGQPVEQAEITVNGGMPQHGHGLPTKPQVTGNLGNGDYLVEGMKFNMPGWWEVTFHISSNGESDSVTFNLVLK